MLLRIYPHGEENAKQYKVSCKKGIRIRANQYLALPFDPHHLAVYQTPDPIQGIGFVLTECSSDQHV